MTTNDPSESHAPKPLAGSAEASSVPPREVDSTQLFQGEKTVVIRHAGEIYRLLVTRHNRLILQK